MDISLSQVVPVSITSPQNSHKAEEYVLTWEAISLLRITEYRILYRLHRARDKVTISLGLLSLYQAAIWAV